MCLHHHSYCRWNQSTILDLYHDAILDYVFFSSVFHHSSRSQAPHKRWACGMKAGTTRRFVWSSPLVAKDDHLLLFPKHNYCCILKVTTLTVRILTAATL